MLQSRLSLQDAQVGELVLANLVAFPALYLAYQAMWHCRDLQSIPRSFCCIKALQSRYGYKEAGLVGWKVSGRELGLPLDGQILIFGGLLEIVAVACLLVSGVLRLQLGVKQFVTGFVLDQRCRFFLCLGSSC